jgi:hypothetical protein
MAGLFPLRRDAPSALIVTRITVRGRRQVIVRTMTNLLEDAISANDGAWAAKLIQKARGIESDEVANYCFPKTWPQDRGLRARIIGDWLRAEARFLA